MKKKIAALVLAIACMVMLTGCFCQHEWKDATCVDPKTCTLCEKTEGEALGHTWADADCVNPKTCSVCAETEGEALGHTWVDADCVNPKTCSVCAETEGEALGHTWLDATTEAPETCSVCAETQGERIITDPRFTTAQTIDLQGKWVATVHFDGEQMDMADFEGVLDWELSMDFGNDGTVALDAKIINEADYKALLLSYTIEATYAELEAAGFSREEANEAFIAEYGMDLEQFCGVMVGSMDFNGMLSEAISAIGGVYYMEDGTLYIGSDWENMDAEEITLEGDVMQIPSLSESLGSELVFNRVVEE